MSGQAGWHGQAAATPVLPQATPEARSAVAARLRAQTTESLETYSFENAAFYADKLASLDPSPGNVLLLGRSHLLQGEPSRALVALQRFHCVPGAVPQEEVFQGKPLTDDVAGCILLAARCLERMKEWLKCLQMLSCFDPAFGAAGPAAAAAAAAATTSTATPQARAAQQPSPAFGIPWSAGLRGAVYSLAGLCCAELDRHQQSEGHYATSLAHDPYQWGSFVKCADTHVPAAASTQVFRQLRFPQDDPLAPVARELYSCKLSVWAGRPDPPLVPLVPHKRGASESCDTDMGSASPPLQPPLPHLLGGGGGGGFGGFAALGGPAPPAGFAGGAEQLVLPEEAGLVGYFGSGNSYVLQCRAERLYYAHFTQQALATAKRVLEQDPHYDACCVLYAASLVAMKKKTDLFQLGHEMATRSPNSPIAWYVVACYYFACEDYDRAGKYFYRATMADPSFLPAWIAYGHTFHALEEGEHTITAYRSALRLFPGCHLAALYMGIEHAKGCNLQHAHTFLDRSVALLGGDEARDPAVCNELGVLYYKSGHYDASKRYFLKSLWRWKVDRRVAPDMPDFGDEGAMLEACLPATADVMRDAFWEPAIFNLGHTYRKMRNYKLALRCYAVCLAVLPHDPSVLAAVGFTYHLMLRYDEAISHYHTALSTHSSDAFCRDMLSRAIEGSFCSSHASPGASDASPMVVTSSQMEMPSVPPAPTASPLFSDSDAPRRSPSAAWGQVTAPPDTASRRADSTPIRRLFHTQQS